VVDPDLELKGGGAFFACPAGFSSFCDFSFTQNKGARHPQAPPLDPPLHKTPNTHCGPIFEFALVRFPRFITKAELFAKN